MSCKLFGTVKNVILDEPGHKSGMDNPFHHFTKGLIKETGQ